MRRAKVALARKPAVIMHRMLADASEFNRPLQRPNEENRFSAVTTRGLPEAKSLRWDDGSGQTAIRERTRLRIRRLADLSSIHPSGDGHAPILSRASPRRFGRRRDRLRGPLQSPDRAKRNPGTIVRLSLPLPEFRFAQPGPQGRKQNVDRRCPSTARPSASARPAGARRLSAFDGGSAPGLTHPKVRLGPGSAKQAPVDGGGIPPASAPVPARSRVRVIIPADIMSEPPGCRGDGSFSRGHRTPAPASRNHRWVSFEEERGFGSYSLSPESSILSQHM